MTGYFRLTAALLFSGFSLFGGAFRVDLAGDGFELAFKSGSEGVTAATSAWLKERSNQRWSITGDSSEKWEEKSFTFTAAEDGKVWVSLLSIRTGPGEAASVSAYDDLRIEGATFKNAGFEELGKRGFPESWRGAPKMATDATDAPEGKYYVTVTFDNRVTQIIDCKAGKPVTIRFKTKNMH